MPRNDATHWRTPCLWTVEICAQEWCLPWGGSRSILLSWPGRSGSHDSGARCGVPRSLPAAASSLARLLPLDGKEQCPGGALPGCFVYRGPLSSFRLLLSSWLSRPVTCQGFCLGWVLSSAPPLP